MIMVDRNGFFFYIESFISINFNVFRDVAQPIVLSFI
jgi:hypothetical protein